ncbi:aminotransferase class I/II-fold pyridoxal phosphate-dependent enzyme [Streptomyces sp. P38-E01]|uniref:8-amino-7-oxononanoate synthase n=1 Tax=Streptomyces tardus TaxID=2780544 RepID=A0A949N5Z4_9ACTN|nr:aminotransferase class I/II-fold pyridoxal phosphate-dependent enzyme [Streptomyces tardus]MBU7598522.1 aminotransferase class I/II-fold pyridoxal phosphate-dependent enzyme [Streptomyces tardus]
MSDIEHDLLQGIAQIGMFQPEEIHGPDLLIRDLGFDSLMVMDLISSMTKKYPLLGDLSADHELFRDDVAVDALRGALRQLTGTPVAAVPRQRAGIERMESVTAFNAFLDASPHLPYFIPHDGVAGAHVSVGGRELVNFASYNYLDSNGAPQITDAVRAAVETYGSSVSASRIIGGEIPLHRELEREIADFIGVDDAVLQVGGHSTNVNVLGHLFGENDLILHDSLAHNSIIQGALLSDAKRRPFHHNDMGHLARELKRLRPRFRNIVVVVEGVYSMDGNICDLPELVKLKEEHDVFLMVDEAHSFGTMGASGRGICSHFGISPERVDILMGTLSKSFNSCGGYLAGNRDFVRYLRYNLPGFVFSVGMTPANTAAALESLRMSAHNPQWQDELHSSAARLLEGVRALGFDTGLSDGTPIVPLITGDTARAVELSKELDAAGVFVAPITYPAVAESEARLRFFVSRGHSPADIDHTLSALATLREKQPAA